MRFRHFFMFLFNRKARFEILSSRGFYNHLTDECYLKKAYKLKVGKKLNIENPTTFNEKLQWLKIHDRNPLYTNLVDKFLVKSYIENIIGKEYVIPTYGIYNRFGEIDFNQLPNQFVIKCTHDSGGIVICKDKNQFDYVSAKNIIEKCLKRNYYYHGREWPYKNVEPRIIVEKYMEDKESKELRDYKFFCFDGEPKIMFVATDRGIYETKFNFYDMNFYLLPIKQHYPNDTRKIKKPIRFNEMKELAKKLSYGIPFVRIDFYEVNGKVYFGEITFSHFSGLMPFIPDEWDFKLGKMINLPI